MIKKIFSVFLVTLLAQILSIFSISYIYNRNPDESFLNTIAILDSTFSIVTSVLAFGMLQITTRNIVTSKKWEKEVSETQNIRMSFAFYISILCLILYFFSEKPLFLYFTTSIFIANNVNYALYGLGKSLQASITSSLRLIINALGLLLMGYLCVYNSLFYFILFSITILITSIYSNFLLKLKLKFQFQLINDFYKSYLKTFKIGITDLAIVFLLDTGILFFADFFYEEHTITNAYIVLKIYLLIKGVQRLVFQTFYNELVNNKKVILLNKIIFIIGLVYFVATVLYTNELASFIFGKISESALLNFKISGFSVITSSILLASIPRTLVIKNDKIYFNSFVLSLFFLLSSMIILSFTRYKDNGIFIALLIGEFVLFLSFFIGIWKDLKIRKYKKFYLMNFLLLAVYFLLNKYLVTEFAILVSIVINVVYGLYFIFFNKKELMS